ncbi:long chain fatty acid-CoA synthetase Faa4p [Nocardia sp. NPDC057030]|uniref:long chain fatty acid-CoA synthetase Faa4p n=1 Tax=unclassified Nocardia TaxID=2637762 RepID=UPI0036292E92
MSIELDPVVFTARVTGRDGRFWAIWIPELGEDARTQALELSDVAKEARDYIAVTLGIPPTEVSVIVAMGDEEAEP